MIHEQATHLVRGFNGKQLLAETWHIGEGSMQTEVEAWKSRMAKGKVTHYEVQELRTHTTERFYAATSRGRRK